MENPTALLQDFQKKAVGFFSNYGKKTSPHRGTISVGIDLGQSHLVVLALRMDSVKPEVAYFSIRERPASVEALSTEIRTLFKISNLDPRKVRIALKGQGVVIRNITFPKMKAEEFASAISYEIEKYIPFKASETQYDFQFLREGTTKEGSELMHVLLVAVRQPEIYQLLRIFQNADLQVELVDVSAFAFANLIEYLHPEIKQMSIGFLDMGGDSTTFGILSRGEPVFIRDVPFGGTDLLRLLKRKLNMEADTVLGMLNDPKSISAEFRETVNSGLATFAKELKLSLNYYLDRVTGAEPIECLYLGGRGARFFQHSEYLQQETQLSIRRPEALSKIGIPQGFEASDLRQNEDAILVALGLCLRP